MRTRKQVEAQKRNHLVMRLRGAYYLFKALGSVKGMEATDEELIKLKAESETARIKRYRQEYLEERKKLEDLANG